MFENHNQMIFLSVDYDHLTVGVRMCDVQRY